MARNPFTSVSVVVAVAVCAAIGPVGTALAAPACDPIRTTPHFRGQVQTPESVLGYSIGSREASAADIAKSVAAVGAASSPAILLLAGNVHGNEESGAEADLRILYELADRDDCAAQQILDNAVVVIAPTQNPDGREAATRRNHYS